MRQPTEKPNLTMAQSVTEAAAAFEKQRTGHTPQAVTVVLDGDTLVITLQGALPTGPGRGIRPIGGLRAREPAKAVGPKLEVVRRLTPATGMSLSDSSPVALSLVMARLPK